ncbi:MAG: hypothetical protein ACTSWP_11590 [Candidatus Freyarchaeota archaeon]|nr:hypothetical protein [Candidatus Freyrarchaeum guaymaensis]
MQGALGSLLLRSLFRLEEREVQVIVTKNMPQIALDDREIGPLMEGQTVSLPVWQVAPFIKANVVQCKHEEAINLAELYNYLWNEEQQPPLQPLPDDFYIRLKIFIESSSEGDRRKIIPVVKDLLLKRAEKIVKAALKAGHTKKVSENMLGEERILYQQLSKMISQWLATLHNFLNV